MYKITRLILIDSYKPGTLQEVRLAGPTNLNGVNGAGKTTLLRLIPLFFGESPGRLVPKSRVNESFVQHYLPHDSSYIIFEYQRGRQMCQVALYASLNDGGLCYRFVAKAFELDDYLDTQADGSRQPASCRDLGRRLRKMGVDCSSQIAARNDYRTIIQNLPHAKGAEMRQLIARFSFCDSASGRRLQHIEKIVTGMFMRSTDFRDLREMLVSCIEEEREAIVLELKTDTLDGWCREYRAYLHMEGRRAQMQELEQADEALGLVRHELAELAARVRKLASLTECEHADTHNQLRGEEQALAQAKADWEAGERDMKRGQAEIDARLFAQTQVLRRLEAEKADWDRQDIETKQRHYQSREALRVELDQARQSRLALLEKVSDIDVQFQRLKAEKVNECQSREHELEGRRRDIELQATREAAMIREEHSRQVEEWREQTSEKEGGLHLRLQELKEMRGQLTSQLQEIQADPALLAQREAKRAQLDEALSQQEQAKDQVAKSDAALAKHRGELQKLEQARRPLAEQRQQASDEEARLHKHLQADAGTLLAFLRERHPAWTEHIAKVINPDLLLREDLSPYLAVEEDGSFYGLGLALETVAADRSASEAALRQALAACRAELTRLGQEALKLDEAQATRHKARLALDKERRELELVLGQCRARVKQLKEESVSLDRQIAASKQTRGQTLQENLAFNQAELKAAEMNLVAQQITLKRLLKEGQQALQERLADIDRSRLRQESALADETMMARQAQAQALAELDAQRLFSLGRGGVDPQALADLEGRINQLAERLRLAGLAGDAVEKYQRWLRQEWARLAEVKEAVRQLQGQAQEAAARYQAALAEFEQQRQAIKARLAELEKNLRKLAAGTAMLAQMLEELARYPVLPGSSVALDASHTVALLQTQKHDLAKREQALAAKIAQLVGGLKRALNQYPGARTSSYAEAVVREIGLDAADRAWLPHLRDWYASQGDELKRWLVMQAHTFGSAVRNYQQALARFDRGIETLSRRLAASIDRNIGFDKIDAIHARLISNVAELGYWQKIVAFTERFDAWQRSQDTLLPDEEFADTVQQVAGQLQAQGRVETKLVNLLGLEIAVIENGKAKRATHDEELRQISSHGLSYLILCVFFVALVNMIRRDQPVTIIWPMDELKDLHQMNIERLLTILEDNNISLLSAFPDPDPEVLKFFKNRYEIYGYRELVEMVIDEAYVAEEMEVGLIDGTP